MNRKPTIGMILEHPYPFDIRVEKEARSLSEAGFQIELLAAKGEAKDLAETVGPVSVTRLTIQNNKLLRKINYLRQTILHKNPYWIKAIEDFIKAKRPDVLHVHDLMLAYSTLTAGRKHNIPVVVDLHENYPVGLQMWEDVDKNFLTRKMYGLKQWQKHEQKVVQNADRVIAVVIEAKDRIVNELGAKAENITVISNTEDIDVFDNTPLDPEITNKYKDYFSIMYLGSFGRHRGLETVIEALPLLRDDFPDIRFILVGSGRNQQELEDHIKKMGVEDLVIFEGHVPFKKVPSYIKASDIATVPHASNPHTEATIPHKIFQYMILKVPVLVSDVAPLKRVVDDIGGGEIFKAGDAESCAAAIRKMADPEVRVKLGEEGRRGVESTYNWKNTGRDLVNFYNEFLNA